MDRLPHASLAQSTDRIDWRDLELVLFVAEARTVEGAVCLPDDDVVHTMRLEPEAGDFVLTGNPCKTE